MIMSRRFQSVLLLVLLLVSTGCKKAKVTEPEAEEGPSRQDIRTGIGRQSPAFQRFDAGQDLRNIAQLYVFGFQGGTPPTKVEDLGRELPGPVLQAIKEGKYIVLWNASQNSPSNTVIAYEKDVPTQGGMAAMLDGSVTRMSPQEFQSAPKAGKR